MKKPGHVPRALEYNKKTAEIVKAFCRRGNYAQKRQLSSVSAADTPINWPKYSQKYDYYINEEGMIELLVGSQQPLAKELAECGHQARKKKKDWPRTTKGKKYLLYWG